MKIDVLIIYEYASRELESALLLEKKLIKHGYKVKIVQIGWNHNLSYLLYRPKLVIVPWCYDKSEYEMFNKYRGGMSKGRYKILNLHCEQIAAVGSEELSMPTDIACDVFHIAWGEYFKNQLRRAGVNEKYVFLTGSSRLDFYREEYRNITIKKEMLAERYNLDVKKKWVLLVGGFSCAQISSEQQKELLKKGYVGIDMMAELAKKTYAEVIKWFDYACSNQKIGEQIEFIYRPHPSELTTDSLEMLQNKYMNFHIIKDYVIRDWIVNVDMAFSWCSTSAVEVAARGIPIFNWRPYAIPEELELPLIDKVQRVKTHEEFIDNTIKYAIDENTWFNKEFDNEKEYFYGDYKQSATEKIVDVIEKILVDEQLFCNNTPNIFFGIKKMLNYYIKKILHITGLIYSFPKLMFIEDAYVSRKDMREYREKIERLL